MQTVRVRGVTFYHRKTRRGVDLYVLPQSRGLIEQLKPENWFHEPRKKFSTGSRPPFRTRTKTVDGKSLDLVVKRSRHGEEIPYDREADTHRYGAYKTPHSTSSAW